MFTSRSSSFVAIACLLAGAGFSSGCGTFGAHGLDGLKRQYRRAIDEMKADAAIMDSDNDGLDAFGPEEAKLIRAARADMNR